MLKGTVVWLLIIVSMGGCASSSSLEKKASNNTKAGEYYRSIGQPQIAEEEFKLARKNRESSRKATSILAELFDIFTDKNE